MPGPLALLGGEAFTDAFAPALHRLIELSGGESARVVIVPTAAAEDGAGVPERRARMTVSQFEARGVEAIAAMVLSREAAHDPANAALLDSASLIYLGGGSPGALGRVLPDTPFLRALISRHQTGTLLVAVSAGAVMLGEYACEPRQPPPADIILDPLPGFGLLPGVAIAPHFDRAPAGLIEQVCGLLPACATLIGIDEQTALLRDAGRWEVIGAGGVTLIRRGVATRYPPGETIPPPMSD
jgi:cyanophycinase